MCGDLDEEGDAPGQARAFQGFREHARRLLEAIEAKPAQEPEDLNRYLDELFARILRLLADEPEGAAVPGYRRLAHAPLVLARLAGLLSGHVPLAEDPLRKAVEALMLGYAEPEAASRPSDDHHHEHGHGHHHH